MPRRRCIRKRLRRDRFATSGGLGLGARVPTPSSSGRPVLVSRAASAGASTSVFAKTGYAIVAGVAAGPRASSYTKTGYLSLD